MIVRIEYVSRDMSRHAVIERNDSGEASEPWDVALLDCGIRTKHQAVPTLTRAMGVARGWCNEVRG